MNYMQASDEQASLMPYVKANAFFGRCTVTQNLRNYYNKTSKSENSVGSNLSNLLS